MPNVVKNIFAAYLQQTRQIDDAKNRLRQHDGATGGERHAAAWAFIGVGEYAADKGEQKWQRP